MVLTYGHLPQSKLLSALPSKIRNRSGRWLDGGPTQVHHLKIVLNRSASLEGRRGLNRSLERGVQVRLAPNRSCVQMNTELFLCMFKDSSLSSSHRQGFQLLLPMAGEAILGRGSSVPNKGPLCS